MNDLTTIQPQRTIQSFLLSLVREDSQAHYTYHPQRPQLVLANPDSTVVLQLVDKDPRFCLVTINMVNEASQKTTTKEFLQPMQELLGFIERGLEKHDEVKSQESAPYKQLGQEKFTSLTNDIFDTLRGKEVDYEVKKHFSSPYRLLIEALGKEFSFFLQIDQLDSSCLLDPLTIQASFYKDKGLIGKSTFHIPITCRGKYALLGLDDLPHQDILEDIINSFKDISPDVRQFDLNTKLDQRLDHIKKPKI